MTAKSTTKKTHKIPRNTPRVPGEPAKIEPATKRRYDMFVAAYMTKGKAWGNGKAAAIAAGYSERTASAAGCKILKVPYVQERIKELEEAMLSEYDMTAESVMKQLAAIVHFDIRRLYNPDGSLKDIADLDDATAAALASAETYEEFENGEDGRKKVGETKKVRVFDKIQAIDRAMRHFGLMKDGGVSINAGKVIISSEDAKLA